MKEVKHDDKWQEDNSNVDDVSDNTEETSELDAMSPEVAPGLSLIVQMRIYDTLMALLREQNPTIGDALFKLHSDGGVLSPMPYYDPDIEP